jgi:hypothetical protein
LIQQLQREQEISEGSQVRGGQITIKIQNTTAQYMSSNVPQQMPTPIYNQPQYFQVQPQYIQTGPTGQQIRVLQQLPPHYMVTQPAPYPGQPLMMHGSPSHSGVLSPGVAPGRQVNYIGANPMMQPYRSLP